LVRRRSKQKTVGEEVRLAIMVLAPRAECAFYDPIPVMRPKYFPSLLLSAVCLLSIPRTALAGPPFITDDPEPVDYQHWEFYLASQSFATANGWTGTAPHVELNYGVIPEVQLHLIAPLAYSAPEGAAAKYGFGDTELGAKIRFLKQTDDFPEAAIFPLLELPTGRASEGLGNGKAQAFLPLWLQKDFGEWTVYGGGGYGLNSGPGNENWSLLGVVVQRQVTKTFALGAEVYHRTPQVIGDRADTAFNVGAVIDFSERDHLLFSIGRSIDGPTDFQMYIAYQITFGPEFFHLLGGGSTAP
jgi:hypothetical protein